MVEILATKQRDLPFVVLRNGIIEIGLSIAVSVIARRGMTTFLSCYKGPLTDLLNMPGAFTDSGLLRLVAGDAANPRSWIDGIVWRLGGRLKNLTGRRPGKRVVIKYKRRRYATVLFIVMKAIVDALRGARLFSGQSPLELTGWHARSETDQAVLQAATVPDGKKRFKARNTGAFYRFPYVPWVPVRTQDVRCFEDIKAALEQYDSPESVCCYVGMVGEGGRRGAEPSHANMLLWAEQDFGCRIMLPGKGTGDEAVHTTIFTRRLQARLARYVDGERRSIDPKKRGMAEFRELAGRAAAGDEAAAAELAAAPLFLNSQGRRLTYDVVWYHCRGAFLAAGIVATLHWLRHEFVFEDMRRIEALGSEKERAVARAGLAAYMGWRTGVALLECYDAYENRRRLLETYVLNAERRQSAVDSHVRNAANDRLPFRAPVLGSATFRAIEAMAA